MHITRRLAHAIAYFSFPRSLITPLNAVQMPHLYNRTDYISEAARADFQDHDRMVIPTSLELPIRTIELSDTFDAFVTIVSSTWEPDYASHPQVLYFDMWPKKHFKRPLSKIRIRDSENTILGLFQVRAFGNL
jgi:hypothetical protein